MLVGCRRCRQSRFQGQGRMGKSARLGIKGDSEIGMDLLIKNKGTSEFSRAQIVATVGLKPRWQEYPSCISHYCT